MRCALLLCALALSLAGQQFNDGYAHGDAPFLIEPGWTPLFTGPDLAGWHGYGKAPSEWQTCKAILWDPLLGPRNLRCLGGRGDRMLNGPNNKTVNFVTDRKFGDIELYLEFMLAKGSNSGVYLHGLYEVQVFDSFAALNPPSSSDGGGIYHRWIDNQGVGGSAPRVNANRPPGDWQSYHIWFQAPRFDAAGKKVKNARFVRVLYNGIQVQQNVDVEGPTRANMDLPEAPENPLMLQGDHGPVAFRNIYFRALRPIIDR
jgi:hypothetical protein